MPAGAWRLGGGRGHLVLLELELFAQVLFFQVVLITQLVHDFLARGLHSCNDAMSVRLARTISRGVGVSVRRQAWSVKYRCVRVLVHTSIAAFICRMVTYSSPAMVTYSCRSSCPPEIVLKRPRELHHFRVEGVRCTVPTARCTALL